MPNKPNFEMSRGNWATMQYALQVYIKYCKEMVTTDSEGAAGWAMSAADGQQLQEKLLWLGRKEGWCR